MKNFSGSNISLVKAHNMRTILLSLLQEGQTSRVQLAHKSSLSSTTITNLTSELLDQGIITDKEFQAKKQELLVLQSYLINI